MEQQNVQQLTHPCVLIHKAKLFIQQVFELLNSRTTIIKAATSVSHVIKDFILQRMELIHALT